MSDQESKVPLPNLDGDVSVTAEMQPAEFIDEGDTTRSAADLEAVFDVPVQVSAVLGRARMDVGELLKLGPGAVLELDRKVGESIDIYVNNRLVARGEVVLVEEKLGWTMTEIIKQERSGCCCTSAARSGPSRAPCASAPAPTSRAASPASGSRCARSAAAAPRRSARKSGSHRAEPRPRPVNNRRSPCV